MTCPGSSVKEIQNSSWGLSGNTRRERIFTTSETVCRRKALFRLTDSVHPGGDARQNAAQSLVLGAGGRGRSYLNRPGSTGWYQSQKLERTFKGPLSTSSSQNPTASQSRTSSWSQAHRRVAWGDTRHTQSLL